MHMITAASADDAWCKCAARYQQPTAAQPQSSRAGPTREFLRVAIEVADPQQHWITSRRPAINPAFALAELVCIMNGVNRAEILNFWNPALSSFCGAGKKFHGAYGFRLRSHFGSDQLDRAYHALKSNADSRQVVLQIWDPSKDLPDINGQPADPDIPCNLCSILKIRKGKLEWLQIIRSNDLFLGLPYNCVQFMSLQEIIAGWLGIGVGVYEQLSDSMHIYSKDFQYLELTDNTIVPLNSDSLVLPKPVSDVAFAEIARRMQGMMISRISKSRLKALSTGLDSEAAFCNMLAIIGADVARRMKWNALAEQLVEGCSNACLKHLWLNWKVRCESRGVALTTKKNERQSTVLRTTGDSEMGKCSNTVVDKEYSSGTL